MFNLVIYTSQFIRKMKEYNIIVSQKQFFNDEVYRRKLLAEAKTLNNKDLPFIVAAIERYEHKM